MPTSEARIAANRLNATRSTGPKTREGKERSRANSLKHGLTGDGVVLVVEDNPEVARLTAELTVEMRPSGRMGRLLLKRIAVLAVRMDRCVAQEDHALKERVRNADRRYVDSRKAEAERLFAWIKTEPETNARRLKEFPEGIDRLIEGWRGIAVDLDDPTRCRFDYHHHSLMENLQGRTVTSFPFAKIGVLGDLLQGRANMDELPEHAAKTDSELYQWGRDELRAIIHGEIAKLEDLRETLDPTITEQDRAEAGVRALFDPSKDATLARRYEAAAERGMYKALDQFREVEAEAAQRPPIAPEQSEGRGSLASFFPGSFDQEAEELDEPGWPDMGASLLDAEGRNGSILGDQDDDSDARQAK